MEGEAGVKRGTPSHPKTLWLKAGLGLSKHEVVGVLELLFHFGAQHAPQGDIGKWSDAQIAEGVEWTRDPAELVRNLVDSGYLDVSKKHRLLLHEWHIHADQGVKKFLQRNGLKFLTLSGHRPPKGRQCPSQNEDHGAEVRTAVSLPLSLSVPLSLPRPVGTEEPPSDPPYVPPDVRTENALRNAKWQSERKLLALVGQIAEKTGKEAQDVMREVTAYKRKADDQLVTGRLNPALLSEERLEKSLEDAEAWLASLEKGQVSA